MAAGCGGASAKPAAPLETAVRASGAGRQVDARMSVPRMVDPAQNELQRARPGSRFVQVDVRWRNLGGDALPIEWARFAVVDREGASHPEAYRLPERVLRHGAADTPRVVPVGFQLPDGARPVAVTMTSAVSALPLRGRWPLPVG